MAKRKRSKPNRSNDSGKQPKSQSQVDDSASNNTTDELADTKDGPLLPAGIAKTPLRRIGVFASGLLFTLWLGFLAFVAWKVVSP
jgi:hypothetical protein